MEKEKNIKNYRLIKKYFFKYKKIFLAGLFFLVFTNVVSLCIPWLLKYAVEGLKESERVRTVSFYALLIVLAGIVQGIFRVFSRVIIYLAGRKIEYDLREEVFSSLIFHPPSFYQTMKTGDVLSRAVNDTSDIRMFMGPGFLQVLNSLLVYIFTISMMLVIHARLTFYVLLPYPILLFIANRYTKYLYHYSEKVQEQLAAISSMAYENLSGIQVIKMFCREEDETERFRDLNREYLERNMELTKKRGMLMPLIAGVGGLATLVLLWAGGAEIIAERITLGDFVAFNGYLAMLLWPTIALGWIMNVLQRGLSAMNRISRILEHRPAQIPETVERQEPVYFQGDISIKNLSFSYGNGKDLLQNISLDIKKGSFVGIVGPIGSGKTTLIGLIPRLYDVGKGMIFIDGRDINTFSLEELRKNIGYVPQESLLFSTSIRENILFGAEKGCRAETYAEISGLMEEAEAFPKGLDSLVGQRGITLSGGQRQRTALARALAVEPKILILDDPFSSVDREKEEEILSALRKFAGDRTLIMVSHRLSTLKEADQIIVLSQGRIEEKGNHKELLKKRGVYMEMFLRQQLREELEKI